MDFIISHLNADFDAFASMMAAGKLYPEAVPVFPGSQEKRVRDFIEDFGPMPVKRVRDIDLKSASRLIVVDTKAPEKTGPFARLLEEPGVEVHLYDHHPHGEHDIHGSFEVVDQVGATTTIFAELLRQKGVKLSPIESTLMCLGIYEETGSLLFPSTTDRDLAAAAWLLKRGASLKIVSSYLKTAFSRQEVEILSELAHTMEPFVVRGVRVAIASASTEEYQGDAAQFAHSLMEMEETDALVVMLRMQGKILMVGRSRMAELNMGDVLEEFGGGGHPSAASATVADMPFEILQERLREVIDASVKPMKVAADIMTRPVVSIDAKSRVKECEAMMTRYGVNVLPLIKDGRFRGIISREAVEKAIFHGFKAHMAMEFATTDITTVTASTPLVEVETSMIEQNQRFMPVLEGGGIIGAITRTDLLRALYEDYLRRTGIKKPALEGEAEPRQAGRKSLSAWLKNRLPQAAFDALVLAGKTARELDMEAYLVGGTVRDLLRGETDLGKDLDIVVEGDGIKFANRLGKKLEAKVRSHERFATAKIIGQALAIDVATARTEYYESPASLPTVETSSIKKDLYRRDFTINTLAVRLTLPEFGKLVDFFGGQRDLKEKTIRVLHDLSFIEDPTRAFRAVRFAERFGFRLSKHTSNLIKSALKMDLFARLSGSRLYEELMMIFDEERPVQVVRHLSEYGLLEVIHSDLMFDEAMASLMEALHEAIAWFELSFSGEKLDRRLLHLMALVAGLGEEARREALKRLAVPQKTASLLMKDLNSSRALLMRPPLEDPAEIYSAMSGLGVETLLFCMASATDQNRKVEISRYLLELSKTKTLITGKDLKRMGISPGPLYSEVLEEILKEKLRGRLTSKEDEERFALTLVGRKGQGSRGRAGHRAIPD